VTAVGHFDDIVGGGIADDFLDDYGGVLGDDYGEVLGDDFVDDFGDDVMSDVRRDMDRLVNALRNALHEDYADAPDEDVEQILIDMLDTMGPAEAFNFSSAISSIGRSASSLLSDPTVASIARTALPVAGGTLGTAIGGPLGAAVGSRLGGLAAGGISTRTPTTPRPMTPTTVPVVPAPVAVPTVAPFQPAAPAAPAAAAPAVVAEPAAPAVPAVVAASPAPATAPVAAGSDAAKKALVLIRQRQIPQSLLATAIGQYGRQQVAGVPVAQVLGTLSQLLGEAAADADELAYLSRITGDAGSESDIEGDLYEVLLDADDLELADAYYQGWDES
jgi:hypothetical protein